jgi:hypothetical protein
MIEVTKKVLNNIFRIRKGSEVSLINKVWTTYRSGKLFRDFGNQLVAKGENGADDDGVLRLDPDGLFEVLVTGVHSKHPSAFEIVAGEPRVYRLLVRAHFARLGALGVKCMQKAHAKSSSGVPFKQTVSRKSK